MLEKLLLRVLDLFTTRQSQVREREKYQKIATFPKKFRLTTLGGTSHIHGRDQLITKLKGKVLHLLPIHSNNFSCKQKRSLPKGSM